MYGGHRLDQNAKEREIGGFAVAKCIASQFWPATDSAMTRFGRKNPRLCDYGLGGRQLGPRVTVPIKGLALFSQLEVAARREIDQPLRETIMASRSFGQPVTALPESRE